MAAHTSGVPTELRNYWQAVKSGDDTQVKAAEAQLPANIVEKLTTGSFFKRKYGMEGYKEACEWYFAKAPSVKRLCTAMQHEHKWIVAEHFPQVFDGRYRKEEHLALLQAALVFSNPDVAEPLLQAGADVRKTTMVSEAPRSAAWDGNLRMLKLLSTVEPYQSDESYIKKRDGAFWRFAGGNLLHRAAQSGSVETFQYLLDKGAILDEPRTDGESVMHCAARSGREEMIAYLVSLGVDVNGRDHGGQTPMHQAANSGNLAVVQALHGAGANLHSKDQHGRTPLHNVPYSFHQDGDALHIIDYLIAQGADPILKDTLCEDSPLDLAAGSGRTEIFCHLLKHVRERLAQSTLAKIRFQATGGFDRAIHNAVFSRSPEKVSLLLAEGANPNLRTHHGSLLHTCTHPCDETRWDKKRLNVLSLLIEAGANVNAGRDKGWTPLHMASSWEQEEVVKALLAAGADPSVLNKDGKTILEVAAENNAYWHRSLGKILAEHRH